MTDGRRRVLLGAQPKSGSSKWPDAGDPVSMRFSRMDGAYGAGNRRRGHFQAPARQLTSQAFGRVVPARRTRPDDALDRASDTLSMELHFAGFAPSAEAPALRRATPDWYEPDLFPAVLAPQTTLR